ncbi:MAG: alcohol dehydrogenase catalytic domain-containing protein [Gammaproteobacteria bacterium]|nr:alcohol dehydrogenase catalytic domain-containing protein [Gammaproteobacteria bacterium]MCP5137941.1 alcohol dehydrogenase catalytic domain-containing protein [Gammaproteobacteria bacterium]
MRGLVLGAEGLRRRDDLPMPVAATDEALIQVRLAGICGTDLAMLAGYAGFRGVPGHEFVGEVVAAADAAWIGQRVVGSINIGCGVCAACRNDGPAHCTRRWVLGIRDHDGAFAEYLTLPLANLHRVPDAVDDRSAVFVEPLAAALRVLDQVAIATDTRAAVIGPGRLGLMVGQVLKAAGADVVMIGRAEASLALPRKLGLSSCIEPATTGFDVVVETSGQAAGLDRALDWVRPRGAVVLKSTYASPPNVDLARVVINEVALMGSRCGPFDKALHWLRAGRVQVEAMIDGVFDLDEFEAAFALARQPGVRKVLLVPKRG